MVREASETILLDEVPPVVHEASAQLLYDLAIAVSAVYQQNIEPTQAGRVPKRIANKVFPLLHGSRPTYYQDDDNYLEMVFAIARHFRLIRLQESIGQKARYAPGPQLEEWRDLPLHEQVSLLLEFWLHSSNSFWSDAVGANYRPGGYSFGYFTATRSGRRAFLEYVKAECQPGQWYALAPFLHILKARVPLLLRESARYTAFGSLRNREGILANWDRDDGEVITGILSSSLHELGLVTLGYQADPAAHGKGKSGNPDAFCFTELAAEVLWNEHTADETMALNESVHTRALIVQPNFELLLLRPDYPILYQLLPFTQVAQIDMVSRLLLTQESVRHGVEVGWSVERIQHTLQQWSQKDLPQNVLYTLQDWGRFYKNATLSQVILLEVDNENDADEICTSARLRALGLRRLGPCAIAVGDQVSLQTLRSTLEKEGVVLHISGK